MKRVSLLFLTGLLLVTYSFSRQYNLKDAWDTNLVLENPDKGWFHHYYDNGTWGYLDGNFDAFPALHHLYMRMAWSYFEPKEGQYDWSKIDDLITKYWSKGYKLSVNVTCKETGPAGSSVPVGMAGYATPKWVRDAGAKGVEVTNWGQLHWEPEWGDPIFLTKLENFHKAFAARYDGKPFMVDIDMGSVGDWGEGHTAVSSKKVTSVAVLKTHMDLYTRVYTKTQVVITDDYFYWGRTDGSAEVLDLIRYAGEKGIAFRDDSPFFMSTNIRHPEFFSEIWKTRPVTIELDHYKDVRSRGGWSVPDGSPTGADRLREIVRDSRCTYLGFHGYTDTYLKDNPKISRELANKVGYWFFPSNLTLPDSLIPGKAMDMSITVENRGIAPSYYPYTAGVKLSNETKNVYVPFAKVEPHSWTPGQTTSSAGTITVPAGVLAEGSYDVHLYIRRESNEDTIPVLVGLSGTIKGVDGSYKIGTVYVKKSLASGIIRPKMHMTLSRTGGIEVMYDFSGKKVVFTKGTMRSLTPAHTLLLFDGTGVMHSRPLNLP